MEQPSLSIGSFGLMVNSNNQNINLYDLTERFKLDVKLNSDRTMLQQKQNDIITAVSKSHEDMCSKNKKQDISRPEHFIKIQYSQNKIQKKNKLNVAGRKTLTRPPIGPIPNGAWCFSCKEKGPSFHSENCKDPLNESLKITLYGFISCIIDNKKSNNNPQIKNLKHELLLKIKKLDKVDTTKQEYINIFNNLNKDLIDDVSYNFNPENPDKDWPLLYIDYNDTLKYIGYKIKKSKSWFSNCSIISYNFPIERSVSVRVYESSLIHLVSCPWEHKEFYKKIIDNIDETKTVVSSITRETENYSINLNETKITNVFSFFQLLPNDSPFNLDLDLMFQYLWPLNENDEPTVNNISPKKVFTKIYDYSKEEIDHDYLTVGNSFYRYTVEYRKDLTTPKIILKLIPCVSENNIPLYCKPFKFSLMIFNSGKIQCTFSFCKDEDIGNAPDQICDSTHSSVHDINTQFENIQQNTENCMNFIYNCVSIPGDNILTDKNDLDFKKDLINTVSGIIPYKKPDKLKVGEEVEIFNNDLMEWENDTGIIESKNIENNDHDTEYNINQNDEIVTKTIKDIKPMKQSSSRVVRLENKPEPYSFQQKCSGGDNYFVPFGGMQSRDNMYYPYCAKKTKDKHDLYINHILNGFPLDNDEDFEFSIDRTSENDNYSGVFKDSITDIGNSIEFINPETLETQQGTIVEKRKTTNNKLDNEVVYKIQLDDDEIIDITGKDFLTKYRQDRRWEGMGGDELSKKIKLINCAKKLGLAQSPYSSKSRNIRLQKKVLKELSEITNCDKGQDVYCGKNTSVLTPTTLLNFTKRPYVGLGFPMNSKRVLLYITPNSQYFIDETMLIMELDFDFTNTTVLLDGYLHKSKDLLRYYPVDCLINNGKKLNMNYINTNTDRDASVRFSDRDASISRELLEELNVNEENYTVYLNNLKYGRLFYTIFWAKILDHNNRKNNVKIENPEDYISPKVSKVNILGDKTMSDDPINYLANRNIIEDTKDLIPNNELLFIPQHGSANYIRWKRLLKTPIVLELIKKQGIDYVKNAKGVSYTVGINGKYIKHINDTPIIIQPDILKLLKKNKILRFDLNFENNGKLNKTNPLTLDIEPIANERDLLSYKRTDLIVDAMMTPIPERMFNSNKEWKIVTVTLTPSNHEPGITPLN